MYPVYTKYEPREAHFFGPLHFMTSCFRDTSLSKWKMHQLTFKTQQSNVYPVHVYTKY